MTAGKDDEQSPDDATLLPTSPTGEDREDPEGVADEGGPTDPQHPTG